MGELISNIICVFIFIAFIALVVVCLYTIIQAQKKSNNKPNPPDTTNDTTNNKPNPPDTTNDTTNNDTTNNDTTNDTTNDNKKSDHINVIDDTTKITNSNDTTKDKDL